MSGALNLLTAVLEGSKIMVVGEEDELKTMVA